MSPPASDLDPASSRIESTHDNECAGSACHRAERALLTIAHTGLKSAKYGCSRTVHTSWSGSNLKTQAAKQLLRWHQVCSAQVLHCLRRWLPYPASPWSHLDMYLSPM